LSQVVLANIKNEDSSLQWDIYSQKAVDHEVHIRDNKIESIRSPIMSEGYAIRIIRRRSEKSEEGDELSGIGLAPGDQIQDEGDVMRTFRFASEASKITRFPSYQIPSKTGPYPEVRISDQAITRDGFGAAKDLAEKVISLSDKERDIRLTFGKIRLTRIDTTLENCFGLRVEKSETFAYFEAGLSPRSVEANELSEFWPHTLSRRVEDLKLESNIPKWAKFARDSAKARPPDTGKYALIVPPNVLSEMLPPVVSFHASASSLKKGMSRWKNRNEKVWGDMVSITDDGLVDFANASSPFDDEGTPQQRTDIIRKGVFLNYIADNMYSKFVFSKSTGNGIKSRKHADRMESPRYLGALCYNDDVELYHTNIVMEGGDSSIEEMITETKRGVLMEQFSWMLPDEATGTFGAEIRHAYLVEGGEIKSAIKGGVADGSFFDQRGTESKGVLSSIDFISEEKEIVDASVLPNVLFPEIRISGR